MATPRYLVENFFNGVMFPSHSFTANESTTGHESWRVGTARRANRNHWTPSTPNQQAYVGVLCNRPRFADMLVIDRNCNLAGKTVRLRFSNDGFASYGEILAAVLPTQTIYGSRLGTQGVRTDEGAWVFRFTGQIATEWRLYVDAMGAGLKPQVGGLYLGQSWSPVWTPENPWDDEARELRFQEVLTPSLWAGSNRKGSRRVAGPWQHVLDSDAEYQSARYHFHGLYWRGHHMWAVPDQDFTERAFLVYAQPGTYGAAYPADFPQRILVLSGVEHQPLALEGLP